MGEATAFDLFAALCDRAHVARGARVRASRFTRYVIQEPRARVGQSSCASCSSSAAGRISSTWPATTIRTIRR
jgi:hypothetical protein